MNRTIRRGMRVAALTAALTAAAPLAATAATADGGVTVHIDRDVHTDVLGAVDEIAPDATPEDLLIEAVDLAADAASGCRDSYLITPSIQVVPGTAPPGSSSTYYDERAGATFSVGTRCRAGVRVKVCITDRSAPRWTTYGAPYVKEGCATKENLTGRTTPNAEALIKVPYLGPDAGGARPYGDITVRIQGFNKRTDGKFPTSPNACLNMHILFTPATGSYTYDSNTNCAENTTEVVLGTLGV